MPDGTVAVNANLLIYIPFGLLMTLAGVVWAVAASVTNVKRDIQENAEGIGRNSGEIASFRGDCAETRRRLFTMVDELSAGLGRVEGELKRINGGGE
jgi:hypothetical protein